jgi:serine/threonine protein phosphatase PrpC
VAPGGRRGDAARRNRRDDPPDAARTVTIAARLSTCLVSAFQRAVLYAAEHVSAKGFPTMLSVSSATHPGTVRTINEDSSAWNPTLSFLVVADGMGGHNAGEVAAGLAVEAAGAFLQRSASSTDFTWPFGINPKASFGVNRLTTAVKLANHRVFRASEERTEFTGMGTTLVIALVENARVTFANVGDSRLYTMRNGALEQLSRDDSWVVMLSRESGLDPSAFRDHPMRNVLTNVIGARPDVEVSVGEFDLADGQLMLLCTDGLHGGLSDEKMTAIIHANSDLQRAADALVQTAVTEDGRDNITVMLARYSASA